MENVTETKLTKWAKEPSVLDLKKDFDECQSAHTKQMGNLARWEKSFNVEPLPENKEKKAQSRISPKLIRKQYEWRCSSLSEPFLSTPELFKANPVSFEDKARAEQDEAVLNYQFQCQINKVPFIDSLIRTCVKEGTAIVRVGWEYAEKEIVITKPVWAYKPAPPELHDQIQQAVQLMQQEPDTFAATAPAELRESVRATLEYQQPVIAQQTGVQEEKQTKPTVNRPTLEVCNIRNVYIDPTCEGDMDKAKFVIHSFESCIADLKADGRYKNLDSLMKTVGEQDSVFHTYQDKGSFTFADIARKKLTVYEYHGYYDVEGNNALTPILASWIGNTLVRLEENPFPDKKLPFIVIPYIPEYKSVYGIPDGELLEDNQKILGAVTRGIIDLLGKSANSQTGVPKGLLDATNLIKFKKGMDYEYNPTSNPNAIYMHKFPEIPQSAVWLIQQVNNDAESLSGVKAFSSGGITGAGLGDSATGVRSAMDAASKREMSILRRIAHGLLQVGRRLLAMNGAWLDKEEVERLTNKPYVPPREDDVAGCYDLTLSISTAEADEAKAKELSFMLQTMGNTMGLEMAQMILSEIARLRKMPDLAKQISSYKPQPDPVQQQMQQLELQKLQAEVNKLQAEAQEAMTKSQVHTAKVDVEKARAENLQGDADLKTQSFVHNQTGESHARELDKQQVVNQGAIDLATAKGDQETRNTLVRSWLDTEAMKMQHNAGLLKSYADAALNSKQATGQFN